LKIEERAQFGENSNMGLWISIAKKLCVDSGNDGTEMEKSINSEGRLFT
jgi:hypothetical protein